MKLFIVNALLVAALAAVASYELYPRLFAPTRRIHHIPCAYHDAYNEQTRRYERWCLPNYTALGNTSLRNDPLEEYGVDGYMPVTLGMHLGQNYTVESRIARGSFGTVWKVRKKRRSYAAKIFKVRHNKVGALEAELAGSIDHPCIIPLRAHFKYANHTVLVFPLLKPLETLKKVNVRQLAQDVLDALMHLNVDFGLIHTDVKPANILYDSRSRRYVLADLGLAEIAPVRNQRLQTLGYRAPEVRAENVTSLTAGIDAWSVGCTVRQLLSQNTSDTEDFLSRALEKNPQLRWSTTKLRGHKWLK